MDGIDPGAEMPAAEQELREQLARLIRQEELRQLLQHGVAEALAASATLAEAGPRLLEVVGSRLGWQAGELWLVDAGRDVLVCHSAWAPAEPTGAPRQLAQSAPGAALARGEGLPGRAWQSGEFLADAGDGAPDDPPRAAADTPEPPGRLAVPLRCHHHVAGVMCWYGPQADRSPALPGILSELGLQIGQFIARFQAEQAVRKSEARFRSLLGAAPDPIVITDAAGVIVLTNQQAAHQFGYSEAELLGRPVEMLMPEGFRQRHLQHRDRYARTPEVRPMGVGMDLLARRKDGSEFPIEISLSPHRAEEGLLVIAVMRDITARKQEEAARHQLHQLQLARSEQLATMGEVAAGLAHEIKNPLAGIAAALDVLGAVLGGDEASREVMAEVQQQVVRIRATLDELLNYARPRPLQLICGDLNNSIEHVVHFAQQQALSRGMELVFLPGQLPPVAHDLDQIQRMVLNLVLNAMEAASRGCRVEVSSVFEANPAGDGVARIVVQDNGPGMSPETIQQIFRPFFTTKGRRGTGLGLSLCRRIAELHHGRIEVSSEPGAGSRFVVSLPNSSGALLDGADVRSV